MKKTAKIKKQKVAFNPPHVKILSRAAVAQMVERIHGKDEVSGSIPDCGSIFHSSSIYMGVLLCYTNAII